MRRSFDVEDTKRALTFEEKITAAWAYYVKGIDQHTLAAIYSVNPGRISEACKTIATALEPERKPSMFQMNKQD
jgi:hypothetical protein